MHAKVLSRRSGLAPVKRKASAGSGPRKATTETKVAELGELDMGEESRWQGFMLNRGR